MHHGVMVSWFLALRYFLPRCSSLCSHSFNVEFSLIFGSCPILLDTFFISRIFFYPWFSSRWLSGSVHDSDPCLAVHLLDFLRFLARLSNFLSVSCFPFLCLRCVVSLSRKWVLVPMAMLVFQSSCVHGISILYSLLVDFLVRSMILTLVWLFICWIS